MAAAIRWGWFDLPLSILLDLFVVVLVLLSYVLYWVMYPIITQYMYMFIHLMYFFTGFHFSQGVTLFPHLLHGLFLKIFVSKHL